MSPSLRFHLFTAAIFVAGIAMAAAGSTVAAWAWATPGTHLLFRIALPLLTVWLLVAMVRLGIGLLRAPRRDADEEEKGEEEKDARSPDPLAALAVSPRRAPDPALRQSSPDAEFVQQIVLPAGPGTQWGSRRRVAQRIGLPGGRHLYRVGPARRGRFTRRPATARRLAVGAAVAVVAIGLLFLLGPFDGNNAG